jgi:hypothetical protein
MSRKYTEDDLAIRIGEFKVNSVLRRELAKGTIVCIDGVYYTPENAPYPQDDIEGNTGMWD